MLLEDYIRQLRDKEVEDSYDLLTPREREILQLLAEGRTNKEVANILKLSLVQQTSRVHTRDQEDQEHPPKPMIKARRNPRAVWSPVKPISSADSADEAFIGLLVYRTKSPDDTHLKHLRAERSAGHPQSARCYVANFRHLANALIIALTLECNCTGSTSC